MAAHGKWERRESHRAAGVFSFRDRHVEQPLVRVEVQVVEELFGLSDRGERQASLL
jgi:hypothetical protein